MSRLEQLRFKHTCSSYGPRLTPLEELELFRLEDEQIEQRGGLSAETRGAGAIDASDPDSEDDEG